MWLGRCRLSHMGLSFRTHESGDSRISTANIHSQTIAAINAILFFLFWLIILLAGADKSPPIGFLWLLPVIALCANVVYWRIPTYIQWSQTHQPGRLLRVALEGFLAGLVVATPFVLFGSGEPTVPIQPIDYVGWFAILGLMGMLNSLALYVINATVAKRLNSDKSDLQ